MAENAAYYDSPLTGEEPDEAFRELSALQESVTSAARSAEEAERWAAQASQAQAKAQNSEQKEKED